MHGVCEVFACLEKRYWDCATKVWSAEKFVRANGSNLCRLGCWRCSVNVLCVARNCLQRGLLEDLVHGVLVGLRVPTLQLLNSSSSISNILSYTCFSLSRIVRSFFPAYLSCIVFSLYQSTWSLSLLAFANSRFLRHASFFLLPLSLCKPLRRWRAAWPFVAAE